MMNSPSWFLSVSAAGQTFRCLSNSYENLNLKSANKAVNQRAESCGKVSDQRTLCRIKIVFYCKTSPNRKIIFQRSFHGKTYIFGPLLKVCIFISLPTKQGQHRKRKQAARKIASNTLCLLVKKRNLKSSFMQFQ